MSNPKMTFLEYMDGLRIPFEELASATNNFSDANRLKQAPSVDLYKGHILQSEEWINIIARKSDKKQSIIENEVKLSYNLVKVKNEVKPYNYHLVHDNIASIFKICKDDNGMLIIVNKQEANGSLDNHLSGSSLSWIQRLRICLGVARALSYIHYKVGSGLSVIHGNIKSSKILLNDQWEPKLSGFGVSIMLTQGQHLHLGKYNGTPQYMDPANETGGLSSKSDVFSFGVLLFEVLFGEVASIQDGDNLYFVRLAQRRYEEKRLDEMIDPDLRQQMHSQSLEIFSKLASCCSMDMRAQRPNMYQIVKGLETALELQVKHECPVNSTIEVKTTASNSLKKVENLEHMRIRLSDIEFATKKFSDIYEIGSGGFGRVYRAELDLGNNSSTSIEGDDKDEPPIKRNTVAIKRIFNRGDSQGEEGFFREVELLSSCKHPNIVSLLGYCDEGGEMILVYEHASNKSLNEYLGNIDNPINLTWAQRIKICIGIAHGLNYLHSCSDDKQRIIHRDIKSDNILLGDCWEAKIADFGLSKLYNANKASSTINTGTIAGTDMYLDPEYKKTGKLKKESDIYSLGVVLFEILCGRLAYDNIYYADNEKGLASIVRRRYKDGTIKDMIDPKIKEEAHENIIMQNRGLIEDSLDTFLEIAYQCLEETQVKRPNMEVIIMQLEKALYFQENRKADLQISIQNINLATENFSDKNRIGRGRYWTAYKGELTHAKGNTTIVAKRWDRKCSRGGHQFLRELDILYKCKHENIISLVGYCKEMDENIIVYEHAFKGSLDTYLRDASLTWVKRLKICMDVAVGLDALHKEHIVTRGPVFHRDIKSTNILVDSDWKAKISNLELSATDTLNQEMEHVMDNNFGTLHYLDPSYDKGFLDKASDIYSFGVVLIEVLHGTLIWNEDIDGFGGYHQFLVLAAKMCYDEGKFDGIVFEGIAKQIVPQSLQTFATIAIQCLHDDSNERPTANQVLVQLKKALEFQEDYDIWEPKVPKDYKELLLMSQTPEKHTIEKKKDLYDIFLKGIILQNGKYFSIGRNGERNEMISSRSFLDKNSSSCQWRSIQESRFSIAAEIKTSELKIHIKIKTQFLSPDVNYRVHLIFRFSGPKPSLAKRMYVNLKYKMGNQNMSSYIASWRDDDWMMIGLYQFLNKKEDTEFEVLLESFSRSYCGNRTPIYVEGIEFQAIEKVKHEEIEKLEEIQQNLQLSLKGDKSWLSMVNKQTHLMLSEVQKKKDHMLSEVRRKKDRVRCQVNKKIDHALGEMSVKECQILGEAATKIVDHLGGAVITRKDQLLTKVSKNYLIKEVKKQKDHLLGKVNKKKDGMVTKMNRMKDNLEVLYENFNEENSSSEHSAQSRFEADNAEILPQSDNYDCEELSSLSIVNRKKHHMLLAKEALICKFSDVKISNLKPDADSRFQDVIELLSNQVFRMKCKIESKMLSPNTEYVCYLLFKLSEKCQGFHCPVIIREVPCWKNKEPGIVYFRSPSPWNLDDADHVPENRAEGWKEVFVWKFNSNHDLRDDYIHINLKFIVYEGTMSGLVVRGLEFRPM